MLKISFIQKELKDKDFLNEAEKVNYQLLKSLAELPFTLDIICCKNHLKHKIPCNKIYVINEADFEHNAISIAKEHEPNITFSTDYIAADILYLHKHTIPYSEQIAKAKPEAVMSALLNWKNYSLNLKNTEYQRKVVNNAKLIFTPSTILKNDLINMYHADGQNIYILPPYTDFGKKIKATKNDSFTFGFVWKNFYDNGGIALLKALRKIVDFDFKIKILINNKSKCKRLKFLANIFGVKQKIDFLSDIDISKFYDAIDSLIVASKMETFGLSVLEAMSRGKIVLLSSRCGAKDIIEPDNNGFIFDVTTAPSDNLAKSMKVILENKNNFENLRQNAIFTASVFNEEKFKSEIERVLLKNFESKEVL